MFPDKKKFTFCNQIHRRQVVQENSCRTCDRFLKTPSVQVCDEHRLVAGSLESANSSILAARNLFKDFGGEKIRIL